MVAALGRLQERGGFRRAARPRAQQGEPHELRGRAHLVHQGAIGDLGLAVPAGVHREVRGETRDLGGVVARGQADRREPAAFRRCSV